MNLRKTTSLTALFSFVVLVISGVVLFPPGASSVLVRMAAVGAHQGGLGLHALYSLIRKGLK